MSTVANSLATKSQACLAAFSTCRKYQDDVGSAISACDQSPSGLTSKLKSLTTNKNLVNDAQAAIASKVKQLKQLVVPDNTRQAAVLACTDLLTNTQDMVDAMKENPASLEVGNLAEGVVNISKVVTCSAADIAQLQSLDSSISEAEVLIADELDNVQSSLEGKSPFTIVNMLHRWAR